MGAWVIQKDHIQYLVAVGMGMDLTYKFRGEERTIDDPIRLGNALFDANKNSVAVLSDEQQGWFAEMPEDALKYNFYSGEDVEAIQEADYAQIYKSAICYECNANGYNDWEQSEAFAYITALKEIAGSKVMQTVDGEVDTEIPDYVDFYVTMTPAFTLANWGAGQLIRRGAKDRD